MGLQHSLIMFQESLRSPKSIKFYTFLVKKFMKYHNIKDDIVRILTDISNKHHNLFRQTIMPHIHPTECRLALLSLHKGVTFQTLVLRVQQDSDLLEQI